jgi:hypothetical protein
MANIDSTARRWMIAMSQWLDGNTAPLVSALLDPSMHSKGDDVREFLADLVANKVSRGKGGRPAERHGWIERALVAEVFKEWDQQCDIPSTERTGSPKDLACEIVAKPEIPAAGGATAACCSIAY